MKKYYQWLCTGIFGMIIGILGVLNVKDTIINFWNTPMVYRMAENISWWNAFDDEISEVESVKYFFINVNGAYQNLIGKNYIYDSSRSNDLIKTPEGYLVSASYTSGYESAIDNNTLQLSETNAMLESMGIDMLYVQAPGKASLNNNDLIEGHPNSSYDKENYFLEEVAMYGINYIDCRDFLNTENLENFFLTDHHWTIETALQVSEKICENLANEGYQFSESTYKADNYVIDIHENIFLGAEGRRVGIYYAGLDDISVICPAFDTDFSVNVPAKGISRNGSFETSVMDETKDTEKYSFTDSAYYMYWGGDYALINVKNNLAENDYKALVIKDSFGIPVSAFLACSFSEMNVVDLRYYEESTLLELVEQEKPDVVIYIYGTGYLTSNSMFRF